MTGITPKFFDHPDYCIRFLEWQAILKLIFKGKHTEHYDYFNAYSQKWGYWHDHYIGHKKQGHEQILKLVSDGSCKSIDDFYEAINKLLKPRKLGKALKDAKKRTAQAAHQLEQLGEDFIDNPELFKEARQVAKYIADRGKSDEMFLDQLTQLVFRHNVDKFTDGQIKTIWKFLDRQVEKYLELDRLEAAILDDDDKNLYFMWGKIKREYPKGDTFTWSTAKAAKTCHCSKQDVKPIMKKLEKLGAIKLLQTGKRGAHSSRAALYVREA
jgi:hypothetical protein